MAGNDTQSLFLQVDASVELLRRHMAEGEQPLDRFENRVDRMAGNVDKRLAKMGGGIAQFEKLIEKAGRTAERSMTDAMNAAEKAAAKLIEAPIGRGAGPNVGATEARQVADAAQMKARAARLVADAIEREAMAYGVVTREQQNAVRGAQLLATQLERTANEAVREAGALERLEIELRQSGTAHDLLNTRLAAGKEVSGQARAGMQQLSFQLGDVATQFASGTSASIIFAQQSGQVIQAISLMTNETKGFLGFLGGPWGIALSSALVLLTPFVGKLFEGNDALEDAVAKLKEDAAQSAISAQAKDIFARSVDGVTAAIKEQNAALSKSIQTQQQAAQAALDSATANFAAAQQARQRTTEELKLAVALREKTRAAPTIAPGGEFGGMAGGFAQAAADRDYDTLKADLRKAQAAEGEGLKGVRLAQIPLSRLRVASAVSDTGATDRKFEAAQARIEGRYRKDGNVAAYEAALTKATQVHNEEVEAVRAANKKVRGPSRDALARRAEGVRQREISEDVSYTDMERAARKRLIDAKQKSAATEEQADALAREEINAERDAEAKKIGLLESAGKLDKAEADRLRAINTETRTQQLRNVDLARAARLIERGYDAKQHGLEAELAQLRLNLDLATTLADRKRISAEILALEQQLRRQALERVRDNPYSTADQVQQAKDDLGRLPGTEQKERDQAAKQNQSPMEEYRDRLKAATDDMNTALQGVEARGLQTLEDGLVGVIMGTESVAGAFKKMAASIIADLARIAIEKAIVAAIGGGSFFGLAGGGAVADVPGFAGGGSPGGMISGPGTGTSDSILALLANGGGAIRISDQEFIVNAAMTKRFLPLLQMINSGGGGLRGFAAGGMPAMAIPAAPRLSFPAIPSLAGRGAGGGEPLTVRLLLSDDLDARIDNRAAGVAVEVVRGAAPGIVQAAKASTLGQISRSTL